MSPFRPSTPEDSAQIVTLFEEVGFHPNSVADLWTGSEGPAEWRALIQSAVERAMQHEDVAEIVAWASTPQLSARWLECGFHARAEDPVLIRQRGALEIPRSVHLQMLDTDAAYLHHGRPGLWS